MNNYNNNYNFSPDSFRKKKETNPILIIVIVLITAIVLFIAVLAAVVILIFGMPEAKPKPYNGAKISSQTIWNDNGIEVKATGIYIEKYLGEQYGSYRMNDGIKLKIKNKSGKDLHFTAISAAVNGATVQTKLEADVADGNSEDAVLFMDNFSLYGMRVETLGNITVELAAEDPSSGDIICESGILAISTNKDGSVETPEYKYDDFTEVFDENGIRLLCAGYGPITGLEMYSVDLAVENSSDRSVRLEFNDLNMNGMSFDYTGSAVIQAHSKGPCYVYAPFNDLNEIEKETGNFFPVSRISGTCSIYDAESGELIDTVSYDYEK